MRIILTTIERDETWREIWQSLNLSLLTFGDLGLMPNLPDALLWQICQHQQIILVTANRNAEGADSLEATLRTQNTADSLPVFTVADAARLMHSPDYVQRVVAQLLDYLMNIDNLRGMAGCTCPEATLSRTIGSRWR
jgi:hypothetical protein